MLLNDRYRQLLKHTIDRNTDRVFEEPEESPMESCPNSLENLYFYIRECVIKDHWCELSFKPWPRINAKQHTTGLGMATGKLLDTPAAFLNNPPVVVTEVPERKARNEAKGEVNRRFSF